jgi:hypothetical protein
VLGSAAQLFFKRPAQCQRLLGAALAAGAADADQVRRDSSTPAWLQTPPQHGYRLHPSMATDSTPAWQQTPPHPSMATDSTPAVLQTPPHPSMATDSTPAWLQTPPHPSMATDSTPAWLQTPPQHGYRLHSSMATDSTPAVLQTPTPQCFAYTALARATRDLTPLTH